MNFLNAIACDDFTLCWAAPAHEGQSVLYCIKDLWGNSNPDFPQTWPDRTETGPRSGNIFKNIFGSGWGILFRVGPGRGIFLLGYETFSPGILGINLHFIPKLRK